MWHVLVGATKQIAHLKRDTPRAIVPRVGRGAPSVRKGSDQNVLRFCVCVSLVCFVFVCLFVVFCFHPIYYLRVGVILFFPTITGDHS